jgi:hypothetical protein
MTRSLPCPENIFPSICWNKHKLSVTSSDLSSINKEIIVLTGSAEYRYRLPKQKTNQKKNED